MCIFPNHYIYIFLFRKIFVTSGSRRSSSAAVIPPRRRTPSAREKNVFAAKNASARVLGAISSQQGTGDDPAAPGPVARPAQRLADVRRFGVAIRSPVVLGSGRSVLRARVFIFW